MILSKFGNNNIGTFGSLVLLKAIDHIKSQVEYLNIEVSEALQREYSNETMVY